MSLILYDKMNQAAATISSMELVSHSGVSDPSIFVSFQVTHLKLLINSESEVTRENPVKNEE